MGSGSLDAMAIMEDRYKDDLTVIFTLKQH